MNLAEKYIQDVLKGKVKVGKYVKLAVERHVADLKKKEFIFNKEEGEKVIEFAQLLNHWKAVSGPITLEPHQAFYFYSLFGWRQKDGTRRFRTSYKEIARKNGKTTESAIKALYHITCDSEIAPQVWFGATVEDQSIIGVNDAGRIAQATDFLAERFEFLKKGDLIKRVVYLDNAAFIAPLGRDSKTKDGWHPSYAIIDEFHAHPTDQILNIVESGMGGRKQPMIDIITTAGFDKSGPCFRLRQNCIDVLEGRKKDDSLFALVYSMDDKDDWKDPKNWIKANPSLDVPGCVDIRFLKDRFTKALNEGGTKEVDFKTKNLNMWVDADKVWLSGEDWDKCDYGVTEEDLKGAVCYGGLDLAKGIDINAFCLFFPEVKIVKGKSIHAVRWYFWTPEMNIKTSKGNIDYTDWVNSGYIMTTPGNIIDHNQVAADIIGIVKQYDFQSLSFDRFLAYHGTIQNLINEGMECHELGQGFRSMSEPSKEFERLVTGKNIDHGNNPVAKWMLGNTFIDVDPAGNIKPNKGKSKNKIDGIVACINALGEYMSSRNESVIDIMEFKSV